MKVIYYGPLANGTAVNKGMSFTISCCQPANQSAVSLNNTYSASFDGAKDAAYTAKYGQPPEMKQGRGRGKGRVGVRGKGRERRDRKKGRGGRGRRAASWQGVGKGREGRDGKWGWRGWRAASRHAGGKGREEEEGRDGKRNGREGMWCCFMARGCRGGRKEREGAMGN